MKKRRNNYKTSKQPRASIIICSWNGGEDIIRALDSLKKQTYKDFEIIISDNGSSDGSIERIRKQYRQVRLIENGVNRGFAGGNNIGIRAALGEIIFTINQDVILENDFIERIMRRFSEAGEDIGTLGGKILRMDGITIDSAGLRLSRARRFSDRGAGEKDAGQYSSEEEVFGICAAAAAYRRSMLEAVASTADGNYFDERFFLLVEDVDLAWRSRHAGYKALYCPDTVCYHIRGGAGWKSKTKQYLSFRNRYYMLIKNEFFVNFLFAIPWFLAYDTSRFFHLAFTNKLLWKGIRELIRQIPGLLRERRRVLKKSKMKSPEARGWMK